MPPANELRRKYDDKMEETIAGIASDVRKNSDDILVMKTRQTVYNTLIAFAAAGLSSVFTCVVGGLVLWYLKKP